MNSLINFMIVLLNLYGRILLKLVSLWEQLFWPIMLFLFLPFDLGIWTSFVGCAAFLRLGYVADVQPELNQVSWWASSLTGSGKVGSQPTVLGLDQAEGILQWKGFTPTGLELSLWVCRYIRFDQFLDMLSLPN